MGKDSKIGWTDDTFNIAIGCEKQDELCKFCYAEILDNRWSKGNNHWGKNAPRRVMSESYWKQPLKWNKDAEKQSVIRKVFCSSLADWAENNETISEQRKKLFPLIKQTPNLIWQLLTKRYDRVQHCLPEDWGNGYENVWLGQSVGKQDLAEKYLDTFLKNKSKVKFLSMEPLLEYVDLKKWLATGEINWVLVGGESSNRKTCRPMEIEWVEKIIDDCRKYNVPIFVKQLGSVLAKNMNLNNSKGEDINEFPEHIRIQEFPFYSHEPL